MLAMVIYTTMTSIGDIERSNGYAIISETKRVIPGTKPEMIPKKQPMIKASTIL